MKKILSTVFMLLASFCLNAANSNDICESEISFPHEIYNSTYVISESEVLIQSCFNFLHGIYHEHFGGINLGNVDNFLAAVAYCEAATE